MSAELVGSVDDAPAEAAERGPAGPRRKLGTVVREELLSDIRTGRWRPGDQLPTEVELMAQFGVSRAPIREAMQSLHLLGIVDISPRRGAIVRALPVQSVVDLAILSGTMGQLEHPVDDVFEFRYAMESAIAERAARSADEHQVESIRGILLENEAAVAAGDALEAQAVDIRFHAAIADASGNVVFAAVAAALNGLLVELRREIRGIPGAAQASLIEHREIFAALAARDGLAARRAAERHIESARERYQSAHGKLPEGGRAPLS